MAKDVLPKSTTKAISPILDKFERKYSGQETLRAGIGFSFLISNEDVDDIIKMLESLEKSSLLIDGAVK